MINFLRAESYDMVSIVVRLFMRMVFCHIIDDFVLQTAILNKVKDKKWWDQFTTYEASPDVPGMYVPKTQYDKDYIVGLIAHGFEWSFMMTLPLMREGWNWMLVILILVNTGVHAYVDDLKCNKLKLNLIQDQCIHLVQIAVTLGLYILVCTI